MQQLSLTAGRCLPTRLAGAFLFLPLLARLRFDEMVQQAGYPGSEMVPATQALLTLLYSWSCSLSSPETLLGVRLRKRRKLGA